MRAMRAEGFSGYRDLKLADIPKPQAPEGRVLVKISAAGVTPLEHTILPGGYSSRKQDQFTRLQFHCFRVKLAHEGAPFRYEMEHHRIAGLHREPPWACHTCPRQHQAVGANCFQPTV
jgi:hypothetical protein